MNNYDYIVYTDGSYQDSIKAGGWASVIIKDNQIVKTLYQGHKNTTNNREEIRGVLETLKFFKEPKTLKIYSDSNYVVNTINEGWIEKWYSEKDFDKKNLDLWFELLDYLAFHNVTMEWVKGHSTNEMNQLADMLAVHAAQCMNIPTDEINTFKI